jgi:pilus assembly protein CpaE
LAGDTPVRCLVVTSDPTAGASIAQLVDRIPGVAAAGVVSAIRVRSGALPACDVVLLSDEPEGSALPLARDLAVTCPHLATVVLASRPGVELYRDALAAGARGIVDVPPSPGALAAAISDAFRLGGAAPAVRRRGVVVGVCGAKGGVGTTLVALALARVAGALLVDLADGYGDLAGLLGCRAERSVTDLAGLGQGLGGGAIASVAVEHPAGLRLVAGAGDPALVAALPLGMGAALVREARLSEPCTILDLGAGATQPACEAAAAADRVVVVVTPDAYAAAAAAGAVTALARASVDPAAMRLVVNRCGRDAELSRQGLARAVGVPVAAVVDDDPRACAALVNGRERLERWPRRRAFRPLVDALPELLRA